MNDKIRYSRQKEIVPGEAQSRPVLVIGAGAIGRQVILQLASIGVDKFIIFDDDTVDESNICTQGFLEAQIGRHKVEVMTEAIAAINKDAQVVAYPDRFEEKSWAIIEKSRSKMDWAPVETIFCCIDCIEGRAKIWQAAKGKGLFIDGRMTAESMRVITVDNRDQEYYQTTLFKKSEAQGATCTAKSTIYCANICAGLMLSQYTKHLRKMAITKDLLFNILGEILEAA